MDSIISKSLSNLSKVIPMVYVLSLLTFLFSWFLPIINIPKFKSFINIPLELFYSIPWYTFSITLFLGLLTYTSGYFADQKSDYKNSNFKLLFNTFYLFWHLSSDFFFLYPLFTYISPEQILKETWSHPPLILPLLGQFSLSLFLISELYFGIIAESNRFLSWMNTSTSSRFH